MTTPVGSMAVAQKIGDHAPVGAVFHHRRFTGEILQPNAPGRDPIITRIIWLRGLEPWNSHAFARCIYIHGTPEEKTIGRPASYGCIRMKSQDVTALYDQIPLGAVVQIVPDALPEAYQRPNRVLLTNWLRPASNRPTKRRWRRFKERRQREVPEVGRQGVRDCLMRKPLGRPRALVDNLLLRREPPRPPVQSRKQWPIQNPPPNARAKWRAALSAIAASCPASAE